MKKNIKLSLILVTLMSSLQAETSNTVVLKPLSITSTAIKTDELRSTDAVEIYTQEDIEKAHVQNVYEFLNSHTSVIATPSYGNPFSQMLDIRGFGSNGHQNIVITLNGRRLNNIDNMPQLLSSISPSSVSRIEIIKSSGIVMGGDGANAGVINIVTKKGNDKEISFYLGTYGVADASFFVGHKDEKLSISASGEAQKSNGIREIDSDGNRDKNKFSTGSLDLAYFATDKLELSLGATFARTDVIYGGPMKEDEYKDNPQQQGSNPWGLSPSTNQTFDSDVLTAGAKYFVNDKISLNANVSQEKKKSAFVPYTPSHYEYTSLSASINYEDELLSLKIGVDGFNGERKQSITKFKKQNSAGFIISEFYLNNSTFKLGYRYETVDYKFADKGLDSTDSLHGAEVGYNYLINKESSIFANYAHSYQAPDIDRFFGFDSLTYKTYYSGALNPMEANNYTLGYSNIRQNNKFKISLYYVDLRNEIYMQPMTFKNTNIDKSYKYGIDLYDKYIFNPEFSLALNYNFVQAIIDEEKEGTSDYSGNHLPGVSDHNIKATLGYTPNKATTIYLTQSYRSEAYAADDFNNNFSQKQDAYMSTDISITYAKESWEVFAKINNLFNQKNALWIYDNALYPVNFTTTALVGFKLKY